MAIATGSHTTYDEAISTHGNREDLSDIIHDVSPTETPVLTGMGRTKATATNHEWLQDALEAAASNAALEGGDMTGVNPADRARLGNYTQILTKNSVVTGSQERADKAGVKSEMAYQMARRMRAIKNDLELAIVGMSNAKVAGGESTSREMGSLDAYIKTNLKLAASGSSACTGDGTDTSDYAGANRAIDETIFTSALQSIWDNASGNESIVAIVPSATKKVISGFTGADERFASTDNKQLVNTIDVYKGDFHTVRIVPDRFCKSIARGDTSGGLTFLLDWEYLKLAEFRPLFSQDIATVGDAKKKQIIWECTLEVCHEKALAVIGDLTT